MASKVDEGFCVYGAGVISRRVQALHEEIEGVRLAEDIEYVHRMRVASRRLRSALPLFETCLPQRHFKNWLKQVRSITQALGAARDTDVQMAALDKFQEDNPDPKLQPGIRRLLLRLRQKRAAYQEEVLTAIEQLESSKVLAAIEKRLKPMSERSTQVYLYTPFLYQQAYAGISSRLDEFLAFEPFVEQPECVAELHAMRIAAKRLRYTLEVFAPIYPGELKSSLQAVRKVQEGLGDIHDSDVWVAILPEFMEKERNRTYKYFGHLRSFHRLIPGIQGYLGFRQQKREEQYHNFVLTWQKLNKQNTWQNLASLIQIPFHQGEPPPTLSTAEKDEARKTMVTASSGADDANLLVEP